MLYFIMPLCIVVLVDPLLLPPMLAFNAYASILFLLIDSGTALATESLPNASQSAVLDRMHEMDRDGDGMASVSEIRAFLLAAHIPEVTASALADWEAVAMGGRCSSPFSSFTVNGGP